MAQGQKTGGRVPGSINKVSGRAKDMIAAFVDNNATEFGEWVKRIAETEPHKAADIYLKALEYNLPKLARTELASDKDNPFSITINYPNANQPSA